MTGPRPTDGIRIIGWGTALPDKTVTNADLEAKFRGNASVVLSTARAEEVIRGVNALATGAPLAPLLAALTPEPARIPR